MIEKYKGAAYRSQYLQTLYKADMQGSDHQAFVGYLLEQIQNQDARIQSLTDLMAELAVIVSALQQADVGNQSSRLPPRVDTKAKAESDSGQVAKKASTFVEPSKTPPVSGRSEYDTPELKHIVIDLGD